MKTILLTGATSFLGRAVTKWLLAAGYRVIAMIRPASSQKESFLKALSQKGLFDFGGGEPRERGILHLLSLDMASAGQLKEKMADKSLYPESGAIDACIHLAWSGVGAAGRMDEGIQEKNVRETRALMESLRALSCRRFLFAGSQAEYGICHGIITEETPCCPLSAYGRAKRRILEEGLALKGEMEYCHLRIFSLYGFGDHPTSLVSACVEGLLKPFREKPRVWLGPCLQDWNYMYVDDGARVIGSLLSLDGGTFSGAGGLPVVNVAGEDTRPLREFALEIEKILGEPGDIAFQDRAPGVEGVPHLNPSIEKLKSLGMDPGQTSFEEGIRKIEKMYRLQAVSGPPFSS